MKRFITLAALVAMGLAVPALQSGVSADPPRKFKICVTGKNRFTGRIVALPRGAAIQILNANVGCRLKLTKPGTNTCRCEGVFLPK